MADNKDVEAEINDVFKDDPDKSLENDKENNNKLSSINQGFDGQVKNTDGEDTLDLNNQSDRFGRNSSKVNPNSKTMLDTIDPIEANQIEFGQDSPNKDGTKSTNKIDEKSDEDEDNSAAGKDKREKSFKKAKTSGENSAGNLNNVDKSQGTQQSEERFNASQELLMGKYNKEEDNEPQDKSIKARAKRLLEWGKANPLKVIIIALGIIIFSLLVCIPIKDWQIRTYPDKIEMQKAVLEGLRIRTADMENWVVKNKSRYARIKKNGEYMIKELFNQTTGPEDIVKKFKTQPDLSSYHQPSQNYSNSPTLPKIISEEDKIGGAIGLGLKYQYVEDQNEETVNLKLPDLFPAMSSNRENILGVFNLRNVQLDSSSNGKNTLFDAYVMLIDTNNLDQNARLDRVAIFRKNEDKDTKVCCMNGGELDLNKYMTGFGVVIKHFYGQFQKGNLLAWRKCVLWTWEGEFRGGYDKHTGFGRLGVNNPTGELAVGYWSGLKKLRGKGVVHTGKYIYAGRWSNEDYNVQPNDLFKVEDLSSK